MEVKKEEILTADSETKVKKAFPKYNFDVVLSEIGSLGRYQLLLVLGAYYITFPTAMNQVASIFVSAIPDFRCRIPGIDDNIGSYPNLTHDKILELSTPYDASRQQYDGCSQYVFMKNCTASDFSQCFSNESTSCVFGHVFDKSTYDSTTTTEWDLVCGKLFLGTMTSMLYFTGVFVGAPIGGNCCDKFGRTRVMIFGQVLITAVGIGCSFSPNVATFTVTRFVIALLTISSSEAAFVYMIEMAGDKSRTLAGVTWHAAFGLGYMTLSGLSYRWRNWRDLQFAITMFSAAFVLIWIFLPESPRWLFSKGHIKKGKKISRQMASRNKRQLSPDIWEQALIKDESKLSQQHIYPHVLFKRPYMRKYTLIMMFLWFVVSLVYYGLTLNSGSLVGDDRINNVLSGAVEVLACPIVILTMDRYGRKPVLSLCFLVSGIACIIATVANQFSKNIEALNIVGTIFALIGKLAASGAFGVIFNYTAEIFPTVVRGTAIGCGSMAARLGSMFSPVIITLQYSVPWLTGVVFGVLSSVAAVTCLLLPETNTFPLTTTLDEAEQFYIDASKPKGKFDKLKKKPQEYFENTFL